jgi:hypothetical protein
MACGLRALSCWLLLLRMMVRVGGGWGMVDLGLDIETNYGDMW